MEAKPYQLEVGNLDHNYRCVICGEFYSWGQSKEAFSCDNCETLFVPYVDQTIYNEAYKDKYVQYEKTELNSQLQTVRWANVLKYKTTGTLLDYGCGAGAFLNAAPKGWDVCGTEINEHCMTHCKEQGLNTIKLLDSLNKEWDVITMFDVLEHLPSLTLLNDIHDALTDNGILVIVTPNLTRDVLKNIHAWRHYRPHGEHTFYFSKKSIEIISDYYNFEVVEVNDKESEVRKPAGNISTYVLKKVI